MKLKHVSLTYYLVLFILTISSCSHDPNDSMYIDIKKQAIVSCSGYGFKEIEIESDSLDLTLEGTDSIIYFDKKSTASRTSLFNNVVFDYQLKLKPNQNYEVTKYAGHDRGNAHMTFRTNSSSKIITASSTNCD